MKHSEHIFMISPVEDETWEVAIDFTRLKKNGICASELLARLKEM